MKSEYLREIEIHLLILDKLITKVDPPECKEKRCLCGGTKTFGEHPYVAEWSDSPFSTRRIEIGNVPRWLCDRNGCPILDIPEPIIDEIKWHIDFSRGSLSDEQILEGINNNYALVYEEMEDEI